ncbi:MAG: asparagine synthase-related protein [Myxococcota bacterium]
MADFQLIRDVFDLTDPDRNTLLGVTLDEARARVRSGNADAVREIGGHFALVAREDNTVRMARSLQVPMRHFIVKRHDGPALVVAHRIDEIYSWLQARGFDDQFHPSYTRMVPAHHVQSIELVGCPDPVPTAHRFFSPRRETLPPNIDVIGKAYVETLSAEIEGWLTTVPRTESIGVCFSGGVDSGAVFLVLHHAFLKLGMNPARLKAFTLSVDGKGKDLEQARRFLSETGCELFHEVVEVSSQDLDLRETIRVVEDYKPLDVQAATMMLALCRGIRSTYPDWVHLIDGDGGDENLKDYPIEENPELTIRSVLNNTMLYQEGWGVDSIKHSLTYSGGLSRGCTRSQAPAARFGFKGFSPFCLPNVIEVAEGIPFIELTGWDHHRLYGLKGKVVAAGVKAVTGVSMPVFEKRRFQHGALTQSSFDGFFPEQERIYRQTFQSIFDELTH